MFFLDLKCQIMVISGGSNIHHRRGTQPCIVPKSNPNRMVLKIIYSATNTRVHISWHRIQILDYLLKVMVIMLTVSDRQLQ